jgi:hypothetical protein
MGTVTVAWLDGAVISLVSYSDTDDSSSGDESIDCRGQAGGREITQSESSTPILYFSPPRPPRIIILSDSEDKESDTVEVISPSQNAMAVSFQLDTAIEDPVGMTPIEAVAVIKTQVR